MPEATFVGREKHINLFRELLNSKPGSPYILNLRGQGGIGKTKILQKFIEICDDEDIPHTQIIDFYGIEMSSRISTVAQTIVKSIGEPDKTLFFNEYWKIKKQFDFQPTHSLEQDLQYHFISGLSEWAKISSEKGKRIAIIFDTFEAVRYSILENTLLNYWLPRLKEAVIVISGRQEKGEINFPEEISQLVIDAPVNTFSEDEATAYLKERKVWDAIKEDKICHEIFKLTQNKPLLLALSADWIFNYVIFPTATPKDLVRDSDQSTFEKKLVQNLPILIEADKPENEILPYMAHVIRPFNKELLVFLKPNISGDDAQKILKNLSELSFIKEVSEIPGEKEEDGPFYWFQDELRRLFHEHIFSVNTTQYERIRQAVSKRMIEYHDIKIKEAKEKGDIVGEKRIIVNRLYHEIYLNPVEGMRAWQKMFQNAREELQYGFASLLLAPVRFVVNYLPNYLSEGQKYMFDLAEGRWMRDMGNAQEAIKRFEKLLSENKNDPQRVPYIYNALGTSSFKLGRFKNALDYHYKSLGLSKEARLDQRLHIEEQHIAEIYQRIGSIQEAIEHYKIAYDLAFNLSIDDERKWRKIATISYELGTMYSLVGEYEIGVEYCNEAIIVLETLQSLILIAQAKMIRGNIYRRAGEYDKALKDIEDAIPLFERNLNYEGLTQAFHYQAYILRVKGEKNNNDMVLLEKSKKMFEKSIATSKRYNLIYNLPRTLHELSRVYWVLGMKEEARKINDEAYKKAFNYHDMYCAAKSIVAMAEFDYDVHNYQTIPLYRKRLKSEFEQQGFIFPLLYGYMERIMGNINFENGYDTQAKDNYAKAIEFISKHSEYKQLKEELDKIEKRIGKLPDENALHFYRGLKSYWLNNTKHEINPKIISWVDKHISHLAFTIKRKNISMTQKSGNI